MSKRNQGRSGPLANTAKSPDDLFEMDEKILGQINRADASMQTALPTSIYDLDPDPTQPRRVVPSAVRKAVPIGTRAPDLLEWWAVMAHQERYGHKPGDAHQAHFYLRSVVAGEIPTPDPSPQQQGGEKEPGVIESALLRVATLAADIRARGKLIHPIHVTSTGRIITGERRWLAHHLLTRYDYPGFDKIMAVESEYDVWVQASENNQRSDLNAIGRARQFAILLMDLLKQERVEFEPLRAFDDEQDYYAQVANSKLHRIPTGGLNQIMGAMGIKSRSLISDYRALLALPKDIWVIADDEGWSHNDLAKIVRSSNNLDDLEQEVDTDPGQDAPVGESASIPNIATPEQPSPAQDEHPNVKLLNLDGIPESVSWWGAYKDLVHAVPDRLFFIRARNDFFALREDAKTLSQIVPSTMPGCHYANTEFGMVFFCPQAVVDYVAESHLVAICDMRRKEAVNDFWHTHMVKDRQSKPAQQPAVTTPPPPPVEMPQADDEPAPLPASAYVGRRVQTKSGITGVVKSVEGEWCNVRYDNPHQNQKGGSSYHYTALTLLDAPPVETSKSTWRPSVNDKVMTAGGQIGVVTHLIGNGDRVSVKTPRSIGVHEIANLRPYIQGADDTPVFQIGDRVMVNGFDPGTIRYIKNGRYGVFFDASKSTHYYDASHLAAIEPGDGGIDLHSSQDKQEPARFQLPFAVEPDGITAGVQLVMDKNRRMVGSWRPSPAHPEESTQWLQGMVALTNGTMAHPQAQALFRVIEYLGGLAGADYFPAQAMADLEMLRSFVERAAGQMQKGGG